jgi:hypothetical protein
MAALAVDVIGWTGTLLVLLAYLLITGRKLGGDSTVYQIMNLFGAIGLIINGYVNGAYPSVGLNVAWSLIALYGLSKGLRLSNRN